VSPYLKKPFIKKGWWSGSRCRLSVQTPELPKNNNNNNKTEKRKCVYTLPCAWNFPVVFDRCLEMASAETTDSFTFSSQGN
jgi:hypothetical protein